MGPGVIVTISVAASVQYTSYILWKFCMKHPEVRDVCDIGRIIFGGSELAYNLTGLMFILNNTFIQGERPTKSLLILLTENRLSTSLHRWRQALEHPHEFLGVHYYLQRHYGHHMFRVQPAPDA
jgi:hypothetical protein